MPLRRGAVRAAGARPAAGRARAVEMPTTSGAACAGLGPCSRRIAVGPVSPRDFWLSVAFRGPTTSCSVSRRLVEQAVDQQADRRREGAAVPANARRSCGVVQSIDPGSADLLCRSSTGRLGSAAPGGGSPPIGEPGCRSLGATPAVAEMIRRRVGELAPRRCSAGPVPSACRQGDSAMPLGRRDRGPFRPRPGPRTGGNRGAWSSKPRSAIVLGDQGCASNSA